MKIHVDLPAVVHIFNVKTLTITFWSKNKKTRRFTTAARW